MNVKYKAAFLLFFIVSFAAITCFAQEEAAKENTGGESDQQINDFSLSGYADKGKKTWDVSGKSADIFTDVVKLKDVNGNLYGDKENVKLTSKTGDFNKAKSKVHLENDVVITTTSGAKLTTDSLDWDKKNNTVSTKDQVNIERDNIYTTAKGALGQPGLNKMELQKDVKLVIKPSQGKIAEKIIITCDGPLSIDYEKNIATFNNNVLVDRTDSKIYSDKMDVYFNRSSDNSKEAKNTQSPVGGKIDKIVASGNVRVVRGENVSYSNEAIYSALDQKIVLTGRPKLVIVSEEGMDAPIGN